MKTGSHWRNICRPIILSTLKAWNGKDERELKKALYEAYPFGERKMYPYKVWLSEISLQLGKNKSGRLWKKKQTENANQERMF